MSEPLVAAGSAPGATVAGRRVSPIAWLCVILAVAGAMLTRNLGQPWNGLDGSNGALFSTIARNYLHYGPLDLGLGQATNGETVRDRSELEYYQHHPPLLPLMVAGTFALFGQGEAQARIGPVVLTLASIVLVFALGRSLYDDAVGVLAAFFFATFPGVLFFGRMTGYEAPTLFLVLLSTWCYLRFFDAGGWRWCAAFYASLLAALWTDWPAFMLAPLLWVHHLIHARKPVLRDPIALWLPLACLGALGAFIAVAWRVDRTSFDDLVGQGLVYMGLLDPSHPLAHRFVEAKETFTVVQYLKRVALRFDLVFAYPTIVLAAAGLWLARVDLDARRRIVLVLAGTAAAYCVVFYRSVYIHYWHTYYFAPSFALLAAVAVRRLSPPSAAGRALEPRAASGPLRGPIVFVAVALVGAGVLPRLATLYDIQLRLFPGEQHEQAMLIKNLGAEVRARTDAATAVWVVNLAETPGARSALGWYSARRILPPAVESARGAASADAGRAARLVWLPADGRPVTLADGTTVAPAASFTVDGQRFALLDAKGGDAAASGR